MNPKMLAAAKFVGLDENATPAQIRKAFTARAVEGVVLMDQSTSAMEGDDSSAKPFDYEGMAAKMEDAAKCYEDAHFEPDADDKGDEHVKMRKMAAKFRNMAKMSKMAAPAAPAGDASAMAAAVDEKAEEKATAEMASFARSLKIDARGMNRIQLMDAIRASTVSIDKIPELVAATVRDQLATEREKESAASRKASAEVLMSSLRDDYPGDREALKREAERDPVNAAKLARAWLPSEMPAHLFDRMSNQGGPKGGGTAADARSFQAPAAKKKSVVAMGRRFVEPDADFAAEVRRVAEATDEPTKSKVDKMLHEKARPVMFQRLLAADKIVRQTRPDLADQADE